MEKRGATVLRGVKTLNRRVFVGITFFIAVFLLGSVIVTLMEWKKNGDFYLRNQLQRTGRIFASVLVERDAFPQDVCPMLMDPQIDQSKQWFEKIKLEEIIRSCAGTETTDAHKIYYNDVRIWTIIKNLPDNPPKNLIVLATRNVDPTSLRTRLGTNDMKKHIRFKKEKDNLRILRRFAVLINAGGGSIAVPVTSSPDRLANLRYEIIYRNQPFDLTTNLVNDLQVKYLSPDGEVIPTNE